MMEEYLQYTIRVAKGEGFLGMEEYTFSKPTRS
jgi:hypothetical protein